MFIIIRNSPRLERERCADLPHLHVPGDYEEPVQAPAGPPGQVPLQGEDSSRPAHQETLHLSHAGLWQQTLPRLAGTDSLSFNRVGHLVFAGCYETLHRQEARDTGQVRQGGTGSDQEGERWQNPRGRHHANYWSSALVKERNLWQCDMWHLTISFWLQHLYLHCGVIHQLLLILLLRSHKL